MVFPLIVSSAVVGGSSIIRFPVSERDMPGIEHGPLGWHTHALTNELQEIVLQTKLSQAGWVECGWVEVAGSSGTKANLRQPGKLELGFGLSLTIRMASSVSNSSKKKWEKK